MCLRRCVIGQSPRYLFDAAVQTPFHSVLILPLDATVQTLPHSTASQDASTQKGTRPDSSLSLDAAVQTPLRSVVSHDTSTQLPLTEFFIGCIFSNDPFDRQGASSAQCDTGRASPPQPPDIATTCSLSSSSLDGDGHVHTTAPRVLLQPPPGLEQNAPPPGLDKDAHLCTTHGIPVKAAPVRPRLCTQISVTPPQPQVSTIHVGTHPVRSATTGKRSASTAVAGTTMPSVQTLVQEVVLFLNHGPWFFPWSSLVNPNLTGLVASTQPTVISCIINTVSLSFSGIQARRAEILLTLSLLPVVSFMHSRSQ